MRKFSVIAAGLAASLFATSCLACVPMPRDTEAEIFGARGTFVAQVTAVQTIDADACRAHLRRARIEPGMPGAEACEAFGLATLEQLHVVNGEIPAGPLIAGWNAHPLCYVGWTPMVGQTVLAMLPTDPRLIGEGATVVVDPIDNNNLLVRALLDLASAANPAP